MNVLGVETTTRAGSVALVRDGTIIGSLNVLADDTHSRRLIPCIDALLRVSGVDILDIDVIAIAVGPGSFTGIRIGLATAKAMAFALGSCLVGISTLEALAAAAQLESGPIVPLIDAGRNETFRALFEPSANGRPMRRWEDEIVARPEAFSLRVPPGAFFVGDAAWRFREEIAAYAPAGSRVIRGRPFLAEEVGRLGYVAASSGGGGEPDLIDAHYLRKSDAELSREDQAWGSRKQTDR